MQVGSSVSNRYYTTYQTNKSVKYYAGFYQTEDGKMTPNETTENPGFAEFVDYQEFHRAWMSQSRTNPYQCAQQKDNVATSSEIGSVTIAETEDEGEFLGLTMVPEEGQSVTYGMRAMLSDKSTPDNPIVQVVSNLGGKKVIYNVEVNKVNPNNATQLEMFALLSYTDKMGITDGGTFGSHQQLEVYGGNASSIGYCGSLSGADAFLNEKFDWTSIMEKMVQVYKDAGIENQAEDCKALFDFFGTYTRQNETKKETAIDFSRLAPNTSEEVRQAFTEAAAETGYNEGDRMDYISQILVHQVENRQNGVANYTDVFGSSIASALQAAREMLYDLENPLMPDSQRSVEVVKYREQEKEFYRAFIAKLEGVSDIGSVLEAQESIDDTTMKKSISGAYAPSSTKENPVVEVTLQIGEEIITQEINISEVNPRNATQLQMYAFFYHQDMVAGNTGVNTYEKFTSYVENAKRNGHFEGNQGYEEFAEKEHDWQKVMISMWEDYSDAGLYSHMQECIGLNETMEKASIRFVDFDNVTFVNRSSEVSLTYEGPMIPAAIQVAWFEAAGAMENTDRFGHLTRMLSRRIEKALEGVEDEIGAIDAAIEAVKQALQDLEDIPSAEIAKDPATKKEMQEVRSYYETFIQNLEALKESEPASAEETGGETEDFTMIYQEFISVYIEQIFVKIQNGDTEPTYQIGAQSFTEKEWEKFLDKFDSVEEAIQELMKEEQARKEAEEAQKESAVIGDASILLTTESTSCVYETADSEDDDLHYITWYSEEGIFCRKAGQTEGYEWSITFENREQYDEVMEFIEQFPSDWNMRFAAHENFWNDFLNDEIDMEGFMEFINGTNKGVPDYSITIGDSMYIDKDKMQWAKYTNPLGTRLYTAEEMQQMQMEIIAANQTKLTKLTGSYGEVYKQNHPEYNGERIFCEYPGGPLYTADEIGKLKWEQFLDDMNMTGEEMQQKREEWKRQIGYPVY